MTNTTDPRTRYYREYDLARARAAVSQREPAAHQRQALDKLVAWFNSPSRRGGILTLPTGGGKTFTAVRFLCDGPLSQGYKVLWLAHTHHLLEQAIESFGPVADNPNSSIEYEVGRIANRASPLRVRVVSGAPGHWPPSEIRSSDDIVFGTVQTMGKACQSLAACRSFLKSAGGKLVVVFDEAHHSPAPTYRRLLKNLRADVPQMVLLGLTATPTYSDGKRKGVLCELFPDDIIYEVSPAALMRDRILARPVLEDVRTNMITEFDDDTYQQWVKKSGGDIPENVISHLAESQERNSLIARFYIENRERYGKTIVFADRWYQCEQIKTFLEEISDREARKGNGSKVRVGTVYTHVAGNPGSVEARNRRSRDTNANAIEAFKKDDLDVLINIRMLTEGTDVPNAQTVFLTRQTTSQILMTQMIGRVLRGPQFGGTETAQIVAFIDNWKHLINWAEYGQLEGMPPLDDEIIPTKKRPPLHLISIELVQRLILAMGIPDVPAPSFLSMLPVGWYLVEYEAAIRRTDASNTPDAEPSLQYEGDSEQVQQLVLVFDQEQESYETFLAMLETQSLESFEPPDLDMTDQQATLEQWYLDHFATIKERVGNTPLLNPFVIARHMAQHEARPAWYSFDERDHHNLDALAAQHFAANLGMQHVEEALQQEYANPERYWHSIYPNYVLFRAQYDACLRELIRKLRPPLQLVHGVVHMAHTPPEREPSEDIKALVKKRDGNRCLCCGEKHRLQIDHLIPFYRGGRNEVSNLQTLCWLCNGHKLISEVNFRSHQTPLLSAPADFPWLELPPEFDWHDVGAWEKLIRRNINFFYQCAAVAFVEVSHAGTSYMSCRVQLYAGNPPQWLHTHVSALAHTLSSQINERAVNALVSLTLHLTDAVGTPPAAPAHTSELPLPITCKNEALTRDGSCRCCGDEREHELNVERIFPQMTDASNLQTICRTCTTHKQNAVIHLHQENTPLVARPATFSMSAAPPAQAPRAQWKQFVRRQINFFYQCAAVESITTDAGDSIWRVHLHRGNDPHWFAPHMDDLLKQLRPKEHVPAGITLTAPEYEEVGWRRKETPAKDIGNIQQVASTTHITLPEFTEPNSDHGWLKFIYRAFEHVYGKLVVSNVDAIHSVCHITLIKGTDPRVIEPYKKEILKQLQQSTVAGVWSLKSIRLITVDAIKPYVTTSNMIIALTEKGYIKKIKNVADMGEWDDRTFGTLHDVDIYGAMTLLITANSNDSILLCTDKGQVYACKIAHLPDNDSRIPLHTLGIPTNERVVSASHYYRHKSLAFLTRDARMKRLAGKLFDNIPASGVSIGVAQEWIRVVDGSDDLIVVTKKGMAIQFMAVDVREIVTRTALGVSAMSLAHGDEVAGFDTISNQKHNLLVVTARGYVKQTQVYDYPRQVRNGKGVQTYNCTPSKTGYLVAGHVVADTETLILVSHKGRLAVVPVNDIPLKPRASQGEHILALPADDRIVATVVLR